MKVLIAAVLALAGEEMLSHVYVWRSHRNPLKRVCVGESVKPYEWAIVVSDEDPEPDSSLYIDFYVNSSDGSSYMFGTACIWLASLSDVQKHIYHVHNPYSELDGRDRYGTVTFCRASSEPAPPSLFLNSSYAVRTLREECVRLQRHREQMPPLVPEMRQLYMNVLETQTRLPLPVYMYFRMAKPDGRNFDARIAQYFISAMRCRGWTEARMQTGIRQRDVIALDIVADALCATAYSIPYQTDVAPTPDHRLQLVDSYTDPMQTLRGDCDDFSFLIMLIVLYAQRAWNPRTDLQREIRSLLQCYVAAATMRLVNSASVLSSEKEVGAHMNVTLYPRDWFNRASGLALDGPSDKSLPVLILEGTGSMWAMPHTVTPKSGGSLSTTAPRAGLQQRILRTQAPISGTADPREFMLYGGMVFVPDAPVGREQGLLCTGSAYGVSLGDECAMAESVRIAFPAAPSADVLRLLERAETHLPTAIGVGEGGDPPFFNTAKLAASPRFVPYETYLRNVDAWSVNHCYATRETTLRSDALGTAHDFDRFTFFEETLAHGVQRLNVLLLSKRNKSF